MLVGGRFNPETNGAMMISTSPEISEPEAGVPSDNGHARATFVRPYFALIIVTLEGKTRASVRLSSFGDSSSMSRGAADSEQFFLIRRGQFPRPIPELAPLTRTRWAILGQSRVQVHARTYIHCLRRFECLVGLRAPASCIACRSRRAQRGGGACQCSNQLRSRSWALAVPSSAPHLAIQLVGAQIGMRLVIDPGRPRHSMPS